MKRVLRKLGISLAATVPLLLVLEGIVRVAWRDAGEYVGIVVLGTDRTVVSRGVEYTVNHHGLRDDHATERTEGVKRILALGDSFVFGDGLPVHHTVSAQLERALAARGERCEVINGGRGNWNTTHELEALERLTPLYRPDAVVLFFFTNDVLHVESSGPDARPRYTSFRQRAKQLATRNSRLIDWLYSTYKARIASHVGVAQSLLPPDYFELDDTRPGWVAFQRAFAAIHTHCTERGMPLTFVIIPTLSCLDEHYPYAEVRAKVNSVARARGIASVDLFDVFARHDPADLWVDAHNTHWNAHAVSLAVEALLPVLQR